MEANRTLLLPTHEDDKSPRNGRSEDKDEVKGEEEEVERRASLANDCICRCSI